MTCTIEAAEREKFTFIIRRTKDWADRVLGGAYRRYADEQSWAPAVNLCEHADRYTLVVDLAGVNPAEIDLRVEGDALIITGVRPAPEVPGAGCAKRLHLMEIDNGRFFRALELPPDVDTEGIEARYVTGLLWVTIPRK